MVLNFTVGYSTHRLQTPPRTHSHGSRSSGVGPPKEVPSRSKSDDLPPCVVPSGRDVVRRREAQY